MPAPLRLTVMVAFLINISKPLRAPAPCFPRINQPSSCMCTYSARSQDVARRLQDSESKKAVLAMRLQKDLKMKPHEAVKVAKTLLTVPAIARMDLEVPHLCCRLRSPIESNHSIVYVATQKINLKRLLTEHTALVRPPAIPEESVRTLVVTFSFTLAPIVPR